MGQEIEIGSLSLIPKGEGRTFDIEGKRVAVFHTRAGGVFALAANCPHRNGPLADGLVGEAAVVCPLHERVFDLRTGAGVGNDDCVAAFPIRLGADGALFVQLS